jgi:alpha-galactosidase
MFLGGDLTALDSTGKQLLTNDEVIAVDQSGHQGCGRHTPVWQPIRVTAVTTSHCST